MPEIGEVARIVHYLKKHLVGKRILNTLVSEDDIVYGKVGTSAGAFKAAMDGRTVRDARQQGKYFYLVMDRPPHPVLHFGMSGYMRFSMDPDVSYRPEKEETQEWPPKYWKFIFDTEAEDGEGQIAFVDARRLARIRLVDCAGDELRKHSPLKENGPDPVIDKEVLTVQWLTDKLRSKRVPIKALLLDQANISGIGNWVGDELLYQARIHPEQYSNTFTDEQIRTIHESMMKVCDIACETMSDQSKFPADWIMKYRWDKGKKNANVLPNGEKITHIKVGGRTSAVVLSRQKKTGAVAGRAEEEDDDGDDVKEDSAVDGKMDKRDGHGAEKRKSAGRDKHATPASAGTKKRGAPDEGAPSSKNKKSGGRGSTVRDGPDDDRRGRRRSARLRQ